MKRIRILSALLCAAIAFTAAGCSKTPATPEQGNGISANTSEPGSGAMGRWVEEKIDLGMECDVMSAVKELPDGTLRVYARDIVTSQEDVADGVTLYQLESKDNGATWSSVPCALNDSGCTFVGRVACAPNGGALFTGFAVAPDSESRSYGLFYATPEGKVQPVVFDLAHSVFTPTETNGGNYEATTNGMMTPMQEGQPQVGSIGFLNDGLAYANIDTIYRDGKTYFLSTSFLFDPATGEIKAGIEPENEVHRGSLSAVGANAEKLFHMTYESNGARTLYEVDAQGKTTLRMSDLPAARGSFSGCADAEGNYYFLSTTGIYRVPAGGTLTENIVDATGFSFSSESAIQTVDGGLTIAQDGSFYVAMAASETANKNELYRYRFDTTLPAVNANSITVWSLNDNATVRATLVAYAKANTDITVNYTIGMAGDSQDLNKEDVLRALNTQILAGTGPDVLILDGLDATAYAQKGLLLDLSTQVSEADLVPWVKNAYYKAGETYVMPARFSVPILTGPADKMAEITSLETLQQAILMCPPRPAMDGTAGDIYYAPRSDADQYGIGFISVAQLTQFALQTCASSLVQDGKVDSAALRRVLSFVESVGKHSGMETYLPTYITNAVAAGSSDTDPTTYGDGGYEFCFTNNARYGWDMIDTPSYLYACYQTIPEGEKNFRPVSAIVQPGTVPGAYRPRTLLAVSAGTKQKEFALSFAQLMLSETVQNGFYQDGMPILQSAMDDSLARNGSPEQLTKYNVKTDVNALFASLQTPVVQDSVVEEKIIAHAQALIEGRETLDAAVTGTEQDLSLYLAERG